MAIFPADLTVLLPDVTSLLPGDRDLLPDWTCLPPEDRDVLADHPDLLADCRSVPADYRYLLADCRSDPTDHPSDPADHRSLLADCRSNPVDHRSVLAGKWLFCDHRGFFRIHFRHRSPRPCRREAIASAQAGVGNSFVPQELHFFQALTTMRSQTSYSVLSHR